jgi:uncharacterized protein DUF3292
MPLFFIVLTILILSTKARVLLFPPAPLALVDYKSGGMVKPSAGVLGSTDSATGAPENYKGEAIENEASNFVTFIATIATITLTGNDPPGESKSAEVSVAEFLPGPDSMAATVAVAKDKASGVVEPSQDKTKVPMEKAMWDVVRQWISAICVISDTWERLAKCVLRSFVYETC